MNIQLRRAIQMLRYAQESLAQARRVAQGRQDLSEFYRQVIRDHELNVGKRLDYLWGVQTRVQPCS